MVQKNTSRQTNSIVAELDEKIQFVYEVAFAKRELRGLGLDFDTKLEETIKFEIRHPFDANILAKRLAHFHTISGQQTEFSKMVEERNQKASDNQYMTHWYYPYKGKYHPRLVRSIFNILNLKYGQKVLDPFLGSGTTALESHLFGLDFVGFDISPICVTMSKVKVTAGEVAKKLPLYKKEALRYMKLDYHARVSKVKNNTKLVEEPVKSTYQEFLKTIDDERIRNFYLLARLIFASDIGRRGRDFKAFEKNLDTMIASALDLTEVAKEISADRPLGKVRIDFGDARNLKSVENESIDAVITSPPYSIALNYMENDRHALEELGVDISELSAKCIGVAGKGRLKLKQYEEDMQRAYAEMYRALKKGCQCVVVIGEAVIDGEVTNSVEDAVDYCQGLGFELVENLPKKIFGLYNTIKDERVLFLRK